MTAPACRWKPPSGGTLVIPAFAIDRAAVVLHHLHRILPDPRAHADADQIIDWLRAAPPPHTTCLVHGEETAA
ncbi:MBL fold metallo-hydrolase RNA specificity domain-containing protein [Streptomyces goshikiensis]|uniref:MBL fold metallo-hydrolase RNA specificity domain-containing protein n=1 Tax=Streptomyces goshikiensis TaxID=1942 RepID=UPI00364750C2